MSDKLTGAELEKALEERGLPSDGTADEKRAAVEAFDIATSSTLPPSKTGFYRVRHPLFGEYSTRRPNLAIVELVDGPATDRNGRALPPTPLSVADTEAAIDNTTGVEPATDDPKEGSA